MFCAQDVATDKDSYKGTRYIFASIFNQQILYQCSFREALGKRSTIFDPNNNFMGYVMTKKGVITNNFIEFNHLNEVTIDNMLTKMMYELINKPYKEMKYLA